VATTGATARWRRSTAWFPRWQAPGRQLDTFSGSELTRLAGPGAGRRPDLLLLDEPTNHLDIESLEWLEQHLISLDAAVVLVAHDRWFLEAVGTSVLELEAGKGKFFDGPWHAWRREKAARELALGRAIERQQAEIERLERFVTRFRAGTRARQAQSRVKRLERRAATAGHADGPGLEFAFSRPSAAARRVRLRDAFTAAAIGAPLDAEMWLEAGGARLDRGFQRNRQDEPDRTLAGRVNCHRSCAAATRQDRLLVPACRGGGSGAGRCRGRLSGRTGLTPGKARHCLAERVLGANAGSRTTVSGGEHRRLSLAVLVNPAPTYDPRRADEPPRS
jgi:ATP-binding cassette subfamily F protein 3